MLKVFILYIKLYIHFRIILLNVIVTRSETNGRTYFVKLKVKNKHAIYYCITHTLT
jgi:hypothetical protein